MTGPERRYLARVRASEDAARALHPDYDSLLLVTGIRAAIQVDPLTGTWRDPKIGRRIYLTRAGRLRTNPAEVAYRVALRIWAQRAVDALDR